MTKMDIDQLIAKAEAARANAIAGFSQFKVGVALLSKSNKIYTGCNIESSTSLGVCAERTAMFKALSEGEREFIAIAISSSANEYCSPCGACRQILWEYAPGIKVLMSDNNGNIHSISIDELFPMPFDRSILKRLV